MALYRVSNMSEPDWLSQTHKKNYRNISHVVIRFFSVVVIPTKHSSLYIKKNLSMHFTYTLSDKNLIHLRKHFLHCSDTPY